MKLYDDQKRWFATEFIEYGAGVREQCTAENVRTSTADGREKRRLSSHLACGHGLGLPGLPLGAKIR